MFHYNLAHTGLSPYSTSSNLGYQTWKFKAGSYLYSSSPALSGDGSTVYVGSYDDNLYAINTLDGSLKWTFATGGKIVSSSPAIATDGTIYVGSYDGKLYAITDSGTSGTLKWAYTTGARINSSPAIGADGTIYVGSYDYKLYAITDSGTSGTLKWTFTTSSQALLSSPAISSDGSTVYVGSYDDNLYAVNSSDGSEKWAFLTGGSVLSSPAIGSDGTIYVGSDDDKLYAVADCTGVEAPITACTGSGTAAQKWSFTTGGNVNSSPAIGSDGTIYVGSLDDKLYAITDSGTSGTEKWTFTTGGDVSSSPAIGSDGTIFVGSDDKSLYALTDSGSSATERWAFTTAGELISSPAIGSDGTIYIGSADEHLYAVGVAGPTPTPTASPTRTRTPTITATRTWTQPTATPTPNGSAGPATLSFGPEVAGQISATIETVTVTSKSATPLVISSVGVTSTDGSATAEFAVTGGSCVSTSPYTVGPSPDICTITVSFKPSAISATNGRTGRLTITDDAPAGSQTINMQGTGTADVTTSPAGVTINNQDFGNTVTRYVTITNKQSSSVTLTPSITQSATGFALAGGGTCVGSPPAVPANGNCTIAVAYSPSALTPPGESGTLTISASPDLATSPHTVALSATTVPDTIAATAVVGTAVNGGPPVTANVLKVTDLASPAFAIGALGVSIGTPYNGGSNVNAADFSVSSTPGTCPLGTAANVTCYPVTFRASEGTLISHVTESSCVDVTVASDPGIYANDCASRTNAAGVHTVKVTGAGK